MIIAIKEKDRVVIGYSNVDLWDRIFNEDYVDEENLAIKFSDAGKLFACMSMDRRSDMFLFDEELLNTEISPKSIIKEVIPYMKHQFKENGLSIDEEHGWANTLTICDNEHIYDIDKNFAFREVDDYVCHGFKAADIITSVLDDTTDLLAEERIIKAAEFTSNLFKESLFPLVITNTKDKQFKVVYEGENL